MTLRYVLSLSLIAIACGDDSSASSNDAAPPDGRAADGPGAPDGAGAPDGLPDAPPDGNADGPDDAAPPDAQAPDAQPADAPDNQAPTLMLSPPGPYLVVAGQALTITASATDPDGDTLTFTAPHSGSDQDPYATIIVGFGSEPTGGAFDSSTHAFTLDTAILGDFGVRFTVSDGINAPVTQAVTITVQAHPVVINEVQLGTGVDEQRIELMNTSATPFDLGGWVLAVPFDFFALPTITIAPGAFLVIHWDVAGVNTATDIFTGTAFVNRLVGASAIQQIVLRRGDLQQTRDTVDFVRWGTGGGTLYAPQAVAAHQWPANTATVDTSGLTDGASISRTPGVNTEDPADWYVEDCLLYTSPSPRDS